MTALLTLGGMFGSLSSFTPQISYTTMLDNWMVVCILFVFATLLELVFAVTYKLFLAGAQSPMDQQLSKVKQLWAFARDKSETAANAGEKAREPTVPTPDDIEKRMALVEKLITFLFFAAFVIYCLVYWLNIISVQK